MIDLRQARLRSNPRFRLVPYDQLTSAERDALPSLSAHADFFGVLQPPRDSGLPPKSVSRDAALLFLALAEPACLPSLVTNLLGDAADERLRQLVLDQVFEVEQAGQFVCGPDAMGLLVGSRDLQGASHVAQLSSDAIDYAQELDTLPVHELAARLYRFNAIPSTPALQRRFGSDDRLRTFLYGGNGVRRDLQSKWPNTSIAPAWLIWSASPVVADYKLYVSPQVDDLPTVFSVAVDAFAKVDCPRFKVGRGAHGVLRPDKLVAYFPSLDRLQRAAELIQGGANEAAAQGVPFSAPIDPAGLLSWGMDPPRFERAPDGYAVVSWRQWLSERIAIYVVAARRCRSEARAFVRERIALDGVDPANWTPNLAIWRDPIAARPEAA